MIPLIMQTWGGALIYIEGRAARHFGYGFRMNPTLGTVESEVSPRKQGPWNNQSSTFDYFRTYFGGANSIWPGAFYNQSPMAVFKGKVYQTLNSIQTTGSELSIVRFDGSGVFINSGNDEYEARPNLNGPGMELMSPSGVNSDSQNLTLLTRTCDCTMTVHNGILFIVGQQHEKDLNPGDDWPLNNWNYDFTALDSTSRAARQYFWATIDAEDRKTFGPATRFTAGFSTNAPDPELLHMCDIRGYSSDLYFCNPCDVVRIAGGSGTMTLVDTDTQRPTTRALEIWPSEGFVSGVASGPARMLILEGSGFLKSVKFGSQYPSGVDFLADLGSLTIPPGLGQSSNVRVSDPWRTRILDTVDEPMRACALKSFNGQLHAFISTEASGIHHFLNDGADASGVTNWSNVSSSLPDDLTRFDGNISIAEDPISNRMLVSFVTMGNLGVVGHATQKTAGGGTYVYSYRDGMWEEIFVGAPGGTPRGILPLANLGPHTTIPSGTNPQVMQCDDYAVMTYTLTDQLARPVNITVEFSINKGISWNLARRFKAYDTRLLLGSDTSSLATSPNGIEYTFYWDYVNDVGFSVVEEVQLRVTPVLTV
ncbi:hypothetical protein KAR91_50005 [Candidatus Pacearchaeota archaeon]|nr:hypothetical protein [Candidatus Pacearchaeota archaeon]